MKIRKNSFPDELTNIGIDFDGVIHKNSKGFFDGTVYDEPIKGSLEALKRISKKYDIIIFTAKAKKDRGKINGKTGVEMEALTAASIAALTVYDMCKAVDRFMTISNVQLLEKKGGKSGHWVLEP